MVLFPTRLPSHIWNSLTALQAQQSLRALAERALLFSLWSRCASTIGASPWISWEHRNVEANAMAMG